MTDDDTLYKLQLGNVAASIIHGGLAVWAGRKLYKNPDGFGKIEKYFNQHIRQCPPPVEGGIKVTFEEDGRINMLGLLTSFYIITSLAHAFYAFSGPLYYNNAISSGNNWMRWIEYGITSSLMVVIVARFAGISDRSALYTIGSANSAVMFMGQITEMSLQKGDTKTAWTATLVGWWITMWIWGSCIIPKFRQSISELRKANIPILSTDFGKGIHRRGEKTIVSRQLPQIRIGIHCIKPGRKDDAWFLDDLWIDKRRCLQDRKQSGRCLLNELFRKKFAKTVWCFYNFVGNFIKL